MFFQSFMLLLPRHNWELKPLLLAVYRQKFLWIAALLVFFVQVISMLLVMGSIFPLLRIIWYAKLAWLLQLALSIIIFMVCAVVTLVLNMYLSYLGSFFLLYSSWQLLSGNVVTIRSALYATSRMSKRIFYYCLVDRSVRFALNRLNDYILWLILPIQWLGGIQDTIYVFRSGISSGIHHQGTLNNYSFLPNRVLWDITTSMALPLLYEHQDMSVFNAMSTSVSVITTSSLGSFAISLYMVRFAIMWGVVLSMFIFLAISYLLLFWLLPSAAMYTVICLIPIMMTACLLCNRLLTAIITAWVWSIKNTV